MRKYDNGDGTNTFVALEEGNLITGSESTIAHDIARDAQERQKAGMIGSNEMRHAARVDPIVLESWLNKKGVTFQEFCASQTLIRQFLMDPDYAHFRIWTGAI
ncbi:MAG: hypothetical protein KGL39_23665 [Patescibacteria group bacterium]|nr:hypothetical protein [Patescibacteria group bacterium]